MIVFRPSFPFQKLTRGIDTEAACILLFADAIRCPALDGPEVSLRLGSQVQPAAIAVTHVLQFTVTDSTTRTTATAAVAVLILMLLLPLVVVVIIVIVMIVLDVVR